MTTDTVPLPLQPFLDALEGVAPAGRWGGASRATIGIDRSEDWAGVSITIHSNSLVTPKVKRYLLAVTPDKVRALVDEVASLRAAAVSDARNAELRADLENEIRNASAYMAERNQARELVRHYQSELGDADKRIAELETWQPIESAPRDGTEILLWREDCGHFIGSYTSMDSFPLTQSEIDATDEETLFAKDWFTQWPQAIRLEGSEAPTRWRPLPPAPDASSKEIQP